MIDLKSKNTRIILAAVVVLVSLFFNFYRITSVPNGLFFDAAAYSADAIIANKSGDHKVFYPENHGREGLFINAEALMFQLTPVRQYWMPMALSAAVGVLTVLGLYFLASRLWGYAAGLLSAFLMAINFWHVAFSRMALRAILTAMFATWSLYFLVRALEEMDKKRGLLWAALAGAVYGLGWHSYISFRVTVLVVAGVFALYAIQSRKTNSMGPLLGKAAVFSAVSFLVFLPLGLHFLNHPHDFSNRMMHMAGALPDAGALHTVRETLKGFLLYMTIGDWEWLYSAASPRYLAIPVVFLVAAGIVWIALRGWKLRATAIVGLLFVSGFLPGFISGMPFHSLRGELTLLATCMVAALGLLYLLEMVGPRKWRTAAVAIFLVALTAESYYGYFIDWGRRAETETYLRRDCLETAEAINRLPAETPKVVVFKKVWPLVMGIPAPAMIINFLTDTCLPAERQAKNIRYLQGINLPEIPPGSVVFQLR